MDLNELRDGLVGLAGKKLWWEGNATTIAMDGKTKINVEYVEEEDDIYMYCSVAALREGLTGADAVTLLKANLFGKGTGGTAVFAYDEDEKCIVLWDKVNLSGSVFEEFAMRLSFFYLSALHWVNELRTLMDRERMTMQFPAFGTMS